MKKSLISTLCFFVCLTACLWFLQDQLLSKTDKETDKTPEVIIKTTELPLTDWLKDYKVANFEKIIIENDKTMKGYVFQQTGQTSNFLGEKKDAREYEIIETTKSIDTKLEDLGISLTGGIEVLFIYPDKGFFIVFLEQFGGIILLLAILLFGSRMVMGKGMFNTKVGQKASKEKKKTKFSDIAGMEEVKAELSEVVDYLKNPEKYVKVGARHPKGVLLYGEPGSGKTLLARAVAGEADVLFLNVSGSEFMEMLVGMGAAKVRSLFKEAKSVGKAIIFIDEIDAIGRRRGSGHNGANQEQEQTLNQILTEMDGFDNDTTIIVMAATNRPDILDPALLRSGRFDRKVNVTAPTAEERTEIFKYYLKGKKMADNINLGSLTKRTSGLVGADIENIVNEASMRLAKDARDTLKQADFEYALEKVLMGPEKKVKNFKEHEKKLTAYHELGHALLAHLQPDADPVEKISIVRRGHALGVTWTTPVEDKNLYSKKYLLSSLSVMLSGRAAEELFFGKDQITTGAANDFERASQTVRNMLIKYGMDEELGMVVYSDNPDYTFVNPYSEDTAKLIDNKMKQYLDNAYQISKDTIEKYRSKLEKIASILIDKEYITGDEFAMMLNE